MTDENPDSARGEATEVTEVTEVYMEASDQPVAGGQWASGEIETSELVSADPLRNSPTWRQLA
ncbi:hypothetical protein [Actinophytocola sp.]|uniref:hypothetical protein n=1 Tax=Actinophytocola sp. TaxID=1872138 RepID=UPI00389A0A88